MPNPNPTRLPRRPPPRRLSPPPTLSSNAGPHPLRPGPESIAPTETIITHRHSRSRTVSDEEEEELCLGPAKFEEFVIEVFTGSVVDSARAAVMRRVPIGVVGIVGVGAGVRAGKDVVGTVIGVYSIGVAASVYLSLFAG
ncbi:hypothetical protein Vadar_005673 [Vaccinium darrowii]|uniref:Uncharacterized protein n=1 Tax=Vaccinium darrowii TaxID=229202 RepID=A0ACB7WY29_9ERIC|nr:hypothetical protein Vadar_005673 [Vaccinium darrowii]